MRSLLQLHTSLLAHGNAAVYTVLGCRYLHAAWQPPRLSAADACTCCVAARPSAASSHRHKKNEVFLDVVESVNLLVNSNGTLVLSEVRAQSMQPLTAAAATVLNILLASAVFAAVHVCPLRYAAALSSKQPRSCCCAHRLRAASRCAPICRACLSANWGSMTRCGFMLKSGCPARARCGGVDETTSLACSSLCFALSTVLCLRQADPSPHLSCALLLLPPPSP